MKHTKYVDVTVRCGVEVDDAGYPETVGRLAEMEAQTFVDQLTSVANLNKVSRTVVGAKVVSVAVWSADAVESEI
jgi:hypothetical protein